MAFIDTIEDDAGNELIRLVGNHDKYLLPDGTQMFVHATPAWCNRCNSFVMAELLEEPEKMEEHAHGFCDETIAHPGLPFDVVSSERQEAMARNLLEKHLHIAAQWRLALTKRQSPPKCLECGGYDFIRLPENDNWAPHPDHPTRRVRIKERSLATMATAGGLYDTEGRRIAGRHAE